MTMVAAPDTESSIDLGQGLAVHLTRISISGTYPLGGEPLPDNMRLPEMFIALRGVYIENWTGYSLWYDASAETIRVFLGGVELAEDEAYPADMDNINVRAEGWSV